MTMESTATTTLPTHTIIQSLPSVAWFIPMNYIKWDFKETSSEQERLSPPQSHHLTRVLPSMILFLYCYPLLGIRSGCGPVPDQYLCPHLLQQKLGLSISRLIFSQIQSLEWLIKISPIILFYTWRQNFVIPVLHRQQIFLDRFQWQKENYR